LRFNLFYLYHLKYKITVCTLPVNDCQSIIGAYANAGWLEREVVEMFGSPIFNLIDSRCLLLDYAMFTSPMKRAAPCIGEIE